MKKSNERALCVPLLKKTKRIMKLTTLFSLGVACCISASTYAQGYKLSMNKQNSSIIEILKDIEKNSEFTFFFNDNKVNVNKKASINVKDATLDEALAQVLKNTGYDYQIIDRQVLIKTASSSVSSVPSVQQNQKAITGIIKDVNGEPIIGANVVEKGTTNGTVTDIEGRFSLNVAPGATLVVSYIGYTTSEIVVGNKTDLAISLKEDSEMLDEVVVVGYGTMKKKDLTGAVAAVSGDLISDRKTMQLSSALQGAVSGMMVTRNNGAPGASSSIKIRGITTIGDSNPLVIVDGVPIDGIDMVNPNDVENISVLKDAASASIYGSRAAAGVILITTKRAKDNQLSLGYSFEYGFEKPTTFPKYVGPTRFMQMENELRWNYAGNGSNEYPVYSKDLIDNYYDLHTQDPDAYPITDWVDLVLKNTAPRQSHVFNVAGGTKAVKTKASFVYDKTDGLYANCYNERFTFRVNNDFTINKYINASLDFNFRRAKSKKPIEDPFNSADAISIIPSIFAGLWSDGRYGAARTGGNIYAMIKEGGANEWWANQLGGKAAIDVTPFDGFKVSVVFSPTFNFDKGKEFRKSIQYYDAKDPTQTLGYVARFNTTNLNETRNDSYRLLGQLIASYEKSLGRHNLNLMAGYEVFYSFTEALTAGRDNYSLNTYPYLNLGPLDYRNNTGNAYENGYQSWFGRVMYNYAEKYLLQFNIRRDGSSRFHSDYRWGTFPSVSGGWVISEESFMKEANIDWLSFLKVRASWGMLGNERITDSNGNQIYYPYQSSIGFNNILFNQGGKIISSQGAAQSKYAIRDISWETTESIDIGLDASFLNNRLRFSGDYFYKTTKDMLLALEIPSYVGYSNPEKNTGKMFTKGYELEARWSDQIGDWYYSVSANLSDFVSKMGNLGGTEFLGDQVKKKDSQFNEWYGYLSDGLYQTQADVDNSPKLNNSVKPGDVKYRDISGPDGVPDGKISPEYDRVLLGGSLPRYMFGGNVQVGYKDFDFSLAFQGVGSQNVRMTTSMIQPLRSNWGNVPQILDGNYWSVYNTEAQNQQVKYPRLTTTNANGNYAMSDFWLFNGRYVRLKNITLGYTLPNSLTSKVKISRIRFYVSANDLFSISKYPQGWDPETGATAYPITSSYLLGVSVNF